MRYAKSAPAVSSPDGTAGGDYRARAALLDGKPPSLQSQISVFASFVL